MAIFDSAFKKVIFKEGVMLLPNPARGFLQIFSFDFTQEWDAQKMQECLVAQESLVLLSVNISKFSETEIPQEALDQIREIVDFFAIRRKDVIFRPVYDQDGHAMEHEPSSFSLVKGHMEQIADFVASCGQKIFMVQGLLIGNWGEMHSSKYLADSQILTLSSIMMAKLPGNMYFAVRCPYQYRIITEKLPNAKKYLGLFDDAIFASSTDMGTYANEMVDIQNAANYTRAWSREDELTFMKNNCTFSPTGGEVVMGDGYSGNLSQEEIISILSKMGLSYLNRLYDRKILDKWLQEPYRGNDAWKGVNLYAYVDAHLGYRFFVKDVKVKNQKDWYTVRVCIENLGFAPVYFQTSVELILVDFAGDKMVQHADWNLQRVDSGKDRSEWFEAIIPAPSGKGTYELFLKAKRAYDDRPIFLANDIAQEECLLGTIKR